MHPLLESYPVVVEIRVAWGEMDAFQHVNNIYCFRYFEGARVVYFDKIGIVEHMHKTGIGPILGSTSCRYKIPLTYPDTLSVGVKTVSIEEDRFSMHHAIVSHRHAKIAAEGEGVIVLYDYRKGEKTAMPKEIRQRITALEKPQL